MGKKQIPESPHERRVLEDALFFDEYGLPFDPREKMTQWELDAHLAIIEGKMKKRKQENRKMEKKAQNR